MNIIQLSIVEDAQVVLFAQLHTMSGAWQLLLCHDRCDGSDHHDLDDCKGFVDPCYVASLVPPRLRCTGFGKSAAASSEEISADRPARYQLQADMIVNPQFDEVAETSRIRANYSAVQLGQPSVGCCAELA